MTFGCQFGYQPSVLCVTEEVLHAAAEYPAAIKLMAGCVHQLQRAAQPQQLSVQQHENCSCDACQTMHKYLAHPDDSQRLHEAEQSQHTSLQLGSANTAWHVIK